MHTCEDCDTPIQSVQSEANFVYPFDDPGTRRVLVEKVDGGFIITVGEPWELNRFVATRQVDVAARVLQAFND